MVPPGGVAVSARLRTADLVVAGYNLVLCAVWAGLAGRAWYGPWITAAHGLAALLPLWLVRQQEVAGERRVLAALREIYPLLCLLAFWAEIDLLHPVVQPGANDALVAGLDRAVFGRHLNLLWMPAMPQVALSELMHLSYFIYYPLIFLPPLVMAVSSRTDALQDMTLRLMVTYLGCYVIYLAFPVFGPTDLVPMYQGELTDGFFYRLTHAAKEAGNSAGTAFPSSHVAGAATSAVLAWRWLRRPLAWVITVQAAGVLVATVYTQQHWAIDSLAGLAWALLLQSLAVPWLQAVLSIDGGPLVPVLPAPAGFLPQPIAGRRG
jgi:membrane-associated phospholipid phosphatase